MSSENISGSFDWPQLGAELVRSLGKSSHDDQFFPHYTIIDYCVALFNHPINLQALSLGGFWELRSTRLQVAKTEKKHCFSLKIQRPQPYYSKKHDTREASTETLRSLPTQKTKALPTASVCASTSGAAGLLKHFQPYIFGAMDKCSSGQGEKTVDIQRQPEPQSLKGETNGRGAASTDLELL